MFLHFSFFHNAIDFRVKQVGLLSKPEEAASPFFRLYFSVPVEARYLTCVRFNAVGIGTSLQMHMVLLYNHLLHLKVHHLKALLLLFLFL
ncbi:hypothetical protein DCAR_0415486 [Daucus carota subsp. sativus]|uniref:Uncharacterized protein n=1 Tax=Daucus carota subsp. sativus TaxID=79200 RepID=A0A165WAZ7_DAUCS|nr:hypothetical protein DCAR_0415486 [Daucus carota subsp. sativus]